MSTLADRIFVCRNFVKKVSNNKGRNIQIDETKRLAIMSVQSNHISILLGYYGRCPTVVLIPDELGYILCWVILARLFNSLPGCLEHCIDHTI
jgi:hypothetical protein